MAVFTEGRRMHNVPIRTRIVSPIHRSHANRRTLIRWLIADDAIQMLSIRTSFRGIPHPLANTLGKWDRNWSPFHRRRRNDIWPIAERTLGQRSDARMPCSWRRFACPVRHSRPLAPSRWCSDRSDVRRWWWCRCFRHSMAEWCWSCCCDDVPANTSTANCSAEWWWSRQSTLDDAAPSTIHSMHSSWKSVDDERNKQKKKHTNYI